MNYRKTLFFLVLFFLPCCFSNALEQEETASIFLSPRMQTVLVDSTFDVSLFLDTKGNDVNIVELDLKFPSEKLNIVELGGKSFFSVWPEVPIYSNTEGVARFVDEIPEGINTESGLLISITFRARALGESVVEILPSSKVFKRDDPETNILSDFNRSVYTITQKPPDGIQVFSETHASQSRWYNNRHAILTWEKGTEKITDFSFELDNKPFTVPDNIPESQAAITSFEDLNDGLWYFHIKAKKNNVWGPTTHFSVRVDTTPPLAFKPEVEILSAKIIARALLSFSTIDFLSGIDHYEVGIIDKTKSASYSPGFVEAKSPFQLPNLASGNLRVIVRAIDKAGNTRDEQVDILIPSSLFSLIKANQLIVVMLLFFAGFFVLLFYLLLKRKIITPLKNFLRKK